MDVLIREIDVSGEDDDKYLISAIILYDDHIYKGIGSFMDTRIKKYDVNGNYVLSLCGHTGTVYCFAVYDDLLCSGSYDKSIRLWKNDICVKTLRGHTDIVLCLVVYNGYLWSGSQNGIIKKWNKEGECLLTIDAHIFKVWTMVVYDEYLYSGSSDQTVKKWDENGTCVDCWNTNYSVLCILVHNDHFYISTTYEIIKYNKHGEILLLYKNHYLVNDPHTASQFVYVRNNLLYFHSRDGKIYIRDTMLRCVRILYENSRAFYSALSYNGYLYTPHDTMNCAVIKIYGEFWPCHYDGLPKVQKDKLKIWRSAARVTNVQKDLKFLFERELLF